MLVAGGLLSIFLQAVGIIAIIWYGPIGLVLLVPGILLLLVVVAALALSVRVEEHHRFEEVENDYMDREEHKEELLNAIEHRSDSDRTA